MIAPTPIQQRSYPLFWVLVLLILARERASPFAIVAPLQVSSPRRSALAPLHAAKGYNTTSGLRTSDLISSFEPKPLQSFTSSFVLTTLPAPLIAVALSAYYEEPLAYELPLVTILILASLPYGLLTGTVASLASVTTRNPRFFDALSSTYERTVPEGVSQKGGSALSLFLQGLERAGLVGILEDGGAKGLLADVSLAGETQ